MPYFLRLISNLFQNIFLMMYQVCLQTLKGFFFLHNVLNTSSSPQRVKIVTGITKYEGSFTLLGFDKFN